MPGIDDPAPPVDPTQRDAWIGRRARELAGLALPATPRVVHDTSNFLAIDRGDVIALEAELYLVLGNEREGRFGIDEQPKYWVKRALGLGSGCRCILKLVFDERLETRVGQRHFASHRSARKEAAVLEAVAGHPNFMHGRGVLDAAGNLVRVIEFIEGESLLAHLGNLQLDHAEYTRRVLPGLLTELLGCVRGIASLHARGLCHGDIRNDHLLLDAQSGRARWIDFDYEREDLLFDVWSLGNVLNAVAAKGFVTFHQLRLSRPELLARVDEGDGSVFFAHRVMNVHRLYPHLPSGLARMLERYAVSGRARYDRAEQVATDLAACVDQLGAGSAAATG